MVFAVSQMGAPIVGAWIYQNLGPERLWLLVGLALFAIVPVLTALSRRF